MKALLYKPKKKNSNRCPVLFWKIRDMIIMWYQSLPSLMINPTVGCAILNKCFWDVQEQVKQVLGSKLVNYISLWLLHQFLFLDSQFEFLLKYPLSSPHCFWTWDFNHSNGSYSWPTYYDAALHFSECFDISRHCFHGGFDLLLSQYESSGFQISPSIIYSLWLLNFYDPVNFYVMGELFYNVKFSVWIVWTSLTKQN